jgi:hypothetical protein
LNKEPAIAYGLSLYFIQQPPFFPGIGCSLCDDDQQPDLSPGVPSKFLSGCPLTKTGEENLTDVKYSYHFIIRSSGIAMHHAPTCPASQILLYPEIYSGMKKATGFPGG